MCNLLGVPHHSLRESPDFSGGRLLGTAEPTNFIDRAEWHYNTVFCRQASVRHTSVFVTPFMISILLHRCTSSLSLPLPPWMACLAPPVCWLLYPLLFSSQRASANSTSSILLTQGMPAGVAASSKISNRSLASRPTRLIVRVNSARSRDGLCKLATGRITEMRARVESLLQICCLQTNSRENRMLSEFKFQG